ncbi:MAG: hypothetical protein JHD17_09125 [Acidimicrobiia bacterium]|nr:hypothetical protein [Acidimicrobiia bacterium]
MRAPERLPRARSFFALLAHPSLWLTGIRTMGRAQVKGWWYHPPFIPRFEPNYIEFRLATQYGDDGIPEPKDLVTYLHWCRDMDRIRRK